MALVSMTGFADAQGAFEVLRWRWEVQVPELHASIFVIPRGYVKNVDQNIFPATNEFSQFSIRH